MSAADGRAYLVSRHVKLVPVTGFGKHANAHDFVFERLRWGPFVGGTVGYVLVAGANHAIALVYNQSTEVTAFVEPETMRLNHAKARALGKHHNRAPRDLVQPAAEASCEKILGF